MTIARLGPGRRIPYGMALGPLLLLSMWSAASALGVLDRRVLSGPWTVLSTLGQLLESGRLQEHLITSARRAAAGLVIGVVAGTLLALASGLSRLGEALFDGPVQIKRAIPTLALIPLLILWFGIGEPMKIATVGLAVMVPIYLHTHAGLRGIDARYVELSQTLRLTRTEFVFQVALPGALPGFLMGLRLALTSAWLSLVVVEQINAETGIGYMMSLARSYGQTEIIIVGLAVYGSFGLVSDGAIRWVERRALAGLDGPAEPTALPGTAAASSGQLLVPERCSVVFQDARLLPWARVLDNVILGLRDIDARERGRAALGEVGLTGREQAWPLELSGGEQQRVALARSLVRQPQLLLLDELFGALDALTRLRMHHLLGELCARHAPAVLLVTHDVDEAIELADRVLLLDAGQIALDLSIDLRIDLGQRRSRRSPQFLDYREALLTALGVSAPSQDDEASTCRSSAVRTGRYSTTLERTA